MPERRRNHFIPRFLLNRFASRAKKQKRWILELSKNGMHREISTKDAAVGSYFYGNRETGVEDRLSILEGEYQQILSSIDHGKYPNEKNNQISQLMWNITIRTRSIRDSYVSAVQRLFNENAKFIETEECRRYMQQQVIKDLDIHVDRILKDSSEDKRNLVRSLMKNPGTRNILEKVAIESIQSAELSLLSDSLIEKFEREKIFPAAVKAGQISGLSKVMAKNTVPDKFNAPFWTILSTEKEDFILGDACVFGITEQNNYATLLKFGADQNASWKEIYFPISKKLVLVGMRTEGNVTLTPAQVNVGSASISSINFYSSKLSDDVTMLSALIGTENDMISEEEIGCIFEKYRSELDN